MLKLISLLLSLHLSFIYSHVITITDTNYDTYVNESSTWLLDFYASWCGHCKKLEPIYLEASKTFNSKLQFGKIDCPENPTLCKRFSIKGYPTIKYFRDGEIRNFKGARTEEGIRSFGNSIIGPAVITDISLEEIEKLKDREDMVIFLYYSPINKFKNSYNAFHRIARNFQSYAFFVSTNDANVLKTVSSESNPDKSYIVAINDDIKYKTFDFSDASQLKKWVSENRFPLMSELGPQNYEDLVSAKEAVIAVVDPDAPITNNYLTSIRNIAAGNPSYHFGYLDIGKWNTYLEQFGIKKQHTPTVFIYNNKDETYWQEDFVGPLGAQDVPELIAKKEDGRIYMKGNTPYTFSYYYKGFQARLEEMSEVELLFYTVSFALFVVFFMVIMCIYVVPSEYDEDKAIKIRAERLEAAKKGEEKKGEEKKVEEKKAIEKKAD